MTTTIAPTSPPPQSLNDRIADAEEELQSAEEAAGVAVLDGGDERAPAKRISDARATLERLRAAEREQVKRDEAAQVKAREHTEAETRWRWLAWHLDFLNRIAPVIELRAKLAIAEANVMDLPGSRSAVVVGEAEWRWIAEEIAAGRLPELNALPNEPAAGANVHQGRPVDRAADGGLTLAEVAELQRQLNPLVTKAGKAIGKPGNLPW
jgi:hypothetical protein